MPAKAFERTHEQYYTNWLKVIDYHLTKHHLSLPYCFIEQENERHKCNYLLAFDYDQALSLIKSYSTQSKLSLSSLTISVLGDATKGETITL